MLESDTGFSEHGTVWPWAECPGTYIPEKTGKSLECFSVVNLSHCRTMNLKLFANGLISLHKLMGSNNCFFKVIPSISPPWNCIDIYLNAAKTSAFIGEITHANDQLIKSCITGCYLLEAVRVYWVFHILHFGLVKLLRTKYLYLYIFWKTTM